jgi:hypothetical protein
MKAQGTYAGAGGSVDVDRTDYQEQRKNTALGGGVIIIIIVAVAAVLWLFWDRLNAQINGAAEALNPFKFLESTAGIVGAREEAAISSVVQGSNASKPTVAEARNNLGAYYPVKTLTSADYEQMLKGIGDIPASIVKLGNVVTPNEVLTAAAGKGAEAAETVNRLGLNDAYVGLPDVQKGLVTFGEGVGMLFGVDLIQRGAEFSAKSKDTGFSPFGGDIRTAVGLSPTPTGANQNLDGSQGWVW